MDDDQFLSRINAIAAESHVELPLLPKEDAPSAKAIAAWAGFLESCVKRGVTLSDDRWKRVSIEQQHPVTVFSLSHEPGIPRDADFRVGLQLFMGMLGEDDED